MCLFGANDIPIIGIIGGSGLQALDLVDSTDVQLTDLGVRSTGKVTTGYMDGVRVAFLPRHGERHIYPPHRVDYWGNMLAMHKLGAHFVVGTCIAGSLKHEIGPGTFVVPDQFVNLTWGRDESWNMGDAFAHVPMASPYCHCVRRALVGSLVDLELEKVDSGTVAVIQGPRFSTKAESEMYIRNGWDIVNMTQYPEVYFARRMGICYATIAGITDYDVGTGETIAMEPESMDAVLEIFRKIIATFPKILSKTVHKLQDTSCGCATKISEPYYIAP